MDQAGRGQRVRVRGSRVADAAQRLDCGARNPAVLVPDQREQCFNGTLVPRVRQAVDRRHGTMDIGAGLRAVPQLPQTGYGLAQGIEQHVVSARVTHGRQCRGGGHANVASQIVKRPCETRYGGWGPRLAELLRRGEAGPRISFAEGVDQRGFIAGYRGSAATAREQQCQAEQDGETERTAWKPSLHVCSAGGPGCTPAGGGQATFRPCRHTWRTRYGPRRFRP